ncbi:MAG: PTS sugar transporter subunit IIA [Brevinema sp.]
MSFIKELEGLDSIQIVDELSSWEDAVRLSFQPLLTKGLITENYIEETIKKGKEFNFYFLIAPQLGMPHSRPEDGVLKTGVSLLIIKNGVEFESHQHNPIYCLIGLSAIDNSQHIDIMMAISELFGDNDSIINELRQAENKNQVVNILKRGVKNEY